jgi:hypothetical protein
MSDMKKRKFIFILTALLLLTGLFALAKNYQWLGLGSEDSGEVPDAKTELQKLYSAYNKPDTSFGMKGSIRLFDQEDNNTLKEVTPFRYTKSGSEYYCQLGFLQTICADTIGIQIDTLNKQLMVSKINAAMLSDATGSLLPFSKFIQDERTFHAEVAILRKDKEYAITITDESTPAIKKATVFYDPATYRVLKAEIEWWKEATAGSGEADQNRTWLTRIEYEHLAVTRERVADRINSIIVWKEGKIMPAPAYRGYEFQSTF